MIGSFITRGLVLAFGYLYPAYECYKSVEMNKPDIEQLRFWCQYWILVAGLTVCERVGDVFIGWVPMYGEAKLAFFVYLWFPKTKGTTYVYDSFFRPCVAKHETEIDRSLLELRTRAGDLVLLYWQKSASYAQTRTLDILQYIATRSTPKRPAQPQRQSTSVEEPSVPNRKSAPTRQPQDVQLSSSSSSASSSSSSRDHQEDAAADDAISSDTSKTVSAPSVSNELKTSTQALVESSKSVSFNDKKVMEVDAVVSSKIDSAPTSVQDTVMEEATGRLTRARSRKTRAM
ncbi:hypothetical protein CASFOL_021297 [Castilleja foliolosa]|uniref:HVA22-like protein n=1 Tax=Castilleja foliolosa TaxID=1961234 RepID=A0ABD3CW51_9LAMI